MTALTTIALVLAISVPCTFRSLQLVNRAMENGLTSENSPTLAHQEKIAGLYTLVTLLALLAGAGMVESL